MLERLLKPYGFLFLDPLHPTTRKLAAPILSRAVTIGDDLNTLLLQRDRELEAAGYHTQVHVERGTSLFFLLEEGKRIPIRDLRYTPDQLAERSEQLSPNALLRPVVQDYILPTAAYIGGPAEIAYFAQSQVLYERLLGHMPRLVSRSGFTLFASALCQVDGALSIAAERFLSWRRSEGERIASRFFGARGPRQTFRRSGKAVNDQNFDKLRQAVEAFDPTLSDALRKSRAKMLHQLSRIHAKVAREILRRDQRSRDEGGVLYNTVYPHKHLQERFSADPAVSREAWFRTG